MVCCCVLVCGSCHAAGPSGRKVCVRQCPPLLFKASCILSGPRETPGTWLTWCPLASQSTCWPLGSQQECVTESPWWTYPLQPRGFMSFLLPSLPCVNLPFRLRVLWSSTLDSWSPVLCSPSCSSQLSPPMDSSRCLWLHSPSHLQ